MDASLFRRLPPKVRKRIWNHVLCAPEGIEIPSVARRSTFEELLTREIRALALLLVCREIGREALTVFYSENDFFYAPKPFDAVNAVRVALLAYNMERDLHHVPSSPDEKAASKLQDWYGSLAEWLTTIGPTNRALVRSLTIKVGSWDLHMSPEQELPVAWTLHRVGRIFASAATDCAFLINVTVPTMTADLPCRMDLRIRLKHLSEGIKMVEGCFDGGLQALAHLWRTRKMTFARYSELARDIRECSGRLTGFVMEIEMGESNSAPLAQASIEEVSTKTSAPGLSPSSEGELFNGVVSDCTAALRAPLDTSEALKSLLRQQSRGETTLSLSPACDDEISGFQMSARPESELDASFNHLLDDDAVADFGEFVDTECLPTPLRTQGHPYADYMEPLSPTPSSPTFHGAFPSTSPSLKVDVDFEQEVDSLAGSQFQARWRKRMQYFEKSQQDGVMRSGSSLHTDPKAPPLATLNRSARMNDWPKASGIVMGHSGSQGARSSQGSSTHRAEELSSTRSLHSPSTVDNTAHTQPSRAQALARAESPSSMTQKRVGRDSDRGHGGPTFGSGAEGSAIPRYFNMKSRRNMEKAGIAEDSSDLAKISASLIPQKPLPLPAAELRERLLKAQFGDEANTTRTALPSSSTHKLTESQVPNFLDGKDRKPESTTQPSARANNIASASSPGSNPLATSILLSASPHQSTAATTAAGTAARPTPRSARSSPKVAEQLEQLRNLARVEPRDIHPALRHDANVGLGISNKGEMVNIETHNSPSILASSMQSGPTTSTDSPQFLETEVQTSSVQLHGRVEPEQDHHYRLRKHTETNPTPSSTFGFDHQVLSSRSNPTTPVQRLSPTPESLTVVPHSAAIPSRSTHGFSPFMHASAARVQRRSSSISKRTSKSSGHADRHSMSDHATTTNSSGGTGKKKWNVFSSLKESAREAYRKDMREVFGEEDDGDGKGKGTFIATRPTGMM